MGVYVDDAVHGYGRMVMCHMLADTRAELDAMADKIGVARKHYQSPKSPKVSFPHYDICKSKRAEALRAGAAATRILKHLERQGKVRWFSNGSHWGWKLT